jgi:predicted AAA+ superfamily ATPase
LHQKFIDYYRQYLAIGGMPGVVADYSGDGDLLHATILQKNLNDAFIADMAKYADPGETTRIMSVYNSLPSQLAKENRKFQYKVIKSGARVAAYGSAIDWLKASGIVIACNKVNHGRYPVKSYTDPASFKLYHADTGLLCSISGLLPQQIISGAGGGNIMSGAITENYVAASLKSNGYEPFYWESDGKAEMDFIIQKGDQVIPVEVKSADNVRSKSLQQYVSRYLPAISYRISARNFGFENNIKSIPLYAVFCI